MDQFTHDHFNMKNTSDITRTVGQRLKCQHPRIVAKYNKYLARVLEPEDLVMKLVEAKTNTQHTIEIACNDIKQLDQQ